ncbi:MAG: hydrogenase small subunit [Bryobacterales bacterium]
MGQLRLQRLRTGGLPQPDRCKAGLQAGDGQAGDQRAGLPADRGGDDGVLTYMLTFDRIPDLDRRRRPTMFYGQRVHDRCYRRAYFDAGQFVESWDDEGARKGWCLYKMGCRGPTTYNACASTKWNECQSFPIGSGHGCFGCSEDNFWDNGPIYERLSGVLSPTSDLTADRIGKTLGAVVGGGIAVHAAAAAVKTHLTQIRPAPDDTNPPTGSAG